MLDALTRVASLTDAIRCRGLLVHAGSDRARSFTLQVLLLHKAIRRTLRGAEPNPPRWQMSTR